MWIQHLFLLFVVVCLPASSEDVSQEAKHPCWISSFLTAELCCFSKDTDVRGCWDAVEFTYEKCCDADSVAASEKLRSRWNALFDPNGRDLTGCLGGRQPIAERNSTLAVTTVLHGFGLRIPQKHHQKPDNRERRLQWRIGAREETKRCIITETEDLSINLFDELHKKGELMTGWVVNLGAGKWGDAMHRLTQRNTSEVLGIFVDSDGPPKDVALAPGVRFITAEADPGNLKALFQQGGLELPTQFAPSHRLSHEPAPIDFLKVGVSSYDCVLAGAALKLVHPKVIWVEVNLSVPPPLRFVRQWHPGWFKAVLENLKGGRVPATLGCSLSATVAMMHEKGYSLYGVDSTNAVFVDESVAGLLGGAGIDEFLCYHQLFEQIHIHLPPEWVLEWTQDPPHEALHRIWCNFTIHDRLIGIGHMPFTLGL